MSEQKIYNPNNAVKMVQNRCKSAQTSTKYCSVTMKLGPKNHLPPTESDCTGFRITSDVPVMSSV